MSAIENVLYWHQAVGNTCSCGAWTPQDRDHAAHVAAALRDAGIKEPDFQPGPPCAATCQLAHTHTVSEVDQ